MEVALTSGPNSGTNSTTSFTPLGTWNNSVIGGTAVGYGGATQSSAAGFFRYIGNGTLYGFMTGATSGTPESVGVLDLWMPAYGETASAGGGTGGGFVFGDGGIGTKSARFTYHAGGTFSFDTYTGTAPQAIQRGTAPIEVGSVKIGTDTVTTITSSPANGSTCSVKGFVLGEDLHITFCNGTTNNRII